MQKIKIFSWIDAIKQSSLSPVTRHVLLNLSTYMNQDGESCYPSIDEQAKTTGLSRRSVISHLDAACAAGFLFKSSHQFAGQKWKRNEYVAIFPEGFSVRRHEDINAEGGERHSPVAKIAHAGDAPEGGERHDKKVVNDVHSNLPLNSPKETNHKKYKKKPVLLSIEAWEESIGVRLCAEMVKSWCKEKKLTRVVTDGLIQEFRVEMIGKGKEYADFRATFQTYLTKGWLSKTLEQAQQLSRASVTTVENNRGVNL